MVEVVEGVIGRGRRYHLRETQRSHVSLCNRAPVWFDPAGWRPVDHDQYTLCRACARAYETRYGVPYDLPHPTPDHG